MCTVNILKNASEKGRLVVTRLTDSADLANSAS